jgi:hypothetical protein
MHRIGLSLVLFLFCLLSVADETPRNHFAAEDALYSQFLDPPREYSLMPFWFWNGKLEERQIQEQVRRMVDQHVYGAFLHARDGLQTPYLSEAWFNAIGAGLEEAKRSGFFFNFVDEYDWPSGEVRNIWMAGNHQSEVLKRNPQFRMKTIAYKEQIVHGPEQATLPEVTELQSVVVARWLGGGRVDPASLQRIEVANSGPVHWSAPQGDWLIMEFYLEPATGFDGGVVDLMNPEAMKLYFDLSYGEYYRRFGSYFGKTIRYSFSDHEGVFGYRIAWTPSLYDAFAKRAGQDLRGILPLLIYDGGNASRTAREDYLATVTQLYQDSYWSGITRQAKELGIGRSGHAWEETLQSTAAFEGSLFALERGLDPVGVDSLVDFGRQSLNFKVAQSVADFEERRFACENQGVQGTDSYLDMQGLRKVTNAIGAWGVNLFIPHAFDYDVARANYPPDWLHQPYWPNFSKFADYTRRISFMNSEDSHHSTQVLLYYPISSVWAESDPVFSARTDYQRLIDAPGWRNRTVLINDYYDRIILRMSERQWDYNIADDYYFERARVEGNELVIGPQRFRAVVLPPVTTISPETLRKLLDFYRAGGTILGIRTLPNANDQEVGNADSMKAGLTELFGAHAAEAPPPYAEQHNAANGHAFFVVESVETLIDLLDSHMAKDVTISSGPPEHLFIQHRRKSAQDYYWVVNDSERSRSNRVLLAVSGIPEKWDALTGVRSPLPYSRHPEGTEVRLSFDPWDAYYVVFRPQPDAAPEPEQTHADPVRTATREVIKPLVLEGPWGFRPEPEHVSVAYARVKDAREGDARANVFSDAEFDDSSWPSLWLSEAQNTIRDWNVIGPFPNQEDAGFEKAYPPEAQYEPKGSYVGSDGISLEWQRYFGDEPYLSKSLIWMETSGGEFDEESPVVDLNRAFRVPDVSWMVGYALTYVYSPQERPATFVIASDNWAKVWLNHKAVFGQLRHPFWYELNDNWADRFAIDLQKGWNEVLVKVGVGRSGTFAFTFRIADQQGKTISDIVASPVPHSVGSPPLANEDTRWYRVEVPPGTTAVLPPALAGPYRLLVNGKDLRAAGSAPVDFRKWLRREKNVLVLAARKADRLSSPIEFVSGTTPFLLESWTKTGLSNFSGTATYEKTFTLPTAYFGKRAWLDLGSVSSVAEVQINGQDAGTLVWMPYQLEITKLVKPGLNHMRIRVTNTEANARAVGASHSILSKIDHCGLEGPVKIIASD